MRYFATFAVLGALSFSAGHAKAACDPGKLNGGGTCDCPAGYKSVGDPGKARCTGASESGKGGNNFAVVSKCKSGDLDGCKKQCDTFKNYGSCIVLGRMYKEGNGVSIADDEEAFRYFKKACEGGDLLGCVEQGRMHETGKGTPKSADQAVKHYGRACDGKQPVGCRELAGNYFYGDGVGKDVPKALELYQKACDQKDFYACNRLGLIHSMSSPPKLREPIVVQELEGDEAVVLDLDRRRLHTANPVAKLVLSGLAAGRDSEQEIVVAICEAFEVDHETCRRDVEVFVVELRAAGVLEE